MVDELLSLDEIARNIVLTGVIFPMPDQTMIERVARALCRHAGLPGSAKHNGKPMWMDFVGEAGAAITAMREPSEAMKAKGAENFDMPDGEAAQGAAIVFTDMIDAALAEQ